MVNLAIQALKNTGTYMQKGLFHALGASPHQATKHAMEMSFWGRRWGFVHDQFGLPKSMGTVPTGAMDKLGVVGGGVSLLASVGMGAAEGGILGGLRAGIWDVGVDAAMLSHAYSRVAERGGIQKFHYGRLNANFLRRFGTLGNIAAGGAGFADYGLRYLVGSKLAYGMGHALGGGILGTAGALIGGNLGVRHAGKLAMIGGAYYLGKATAYGTYQVLKAGHSHFQAQKAIHTDGDMAAFMTQGAFSMRERAVQAIARSHMNARSALGRESQFMHMPSKSYSSIYRQY